MYVTLAMSANSFFRPLSWSGHVILIIHKSIGIKVRLLSKIGSFQSVLC